jgi:hypothetical protein
MIWLIIIAVVSLAFVITDGFDFFDDTDDGIHP